MTKKEQIVTKEEQIVRSWHVNAAPWTRALRTGSIASRVLVTDRAIVETVQSVAPGRVLDVGCGEGWLARSLNSLGIDVTGVDAVPGLIAEAKARGGGDFRVCTYDDVVQRRLQCAPQDAVICNFSLLGCESVTSLVAALRHYLDDSGRLIVQTLHPVVACGEQPYRDGWREGSWAGFGPEFADPAPWFFRTLAGWHALLRRCGFEVVEYREPVLPEAAAPSSLIFVGAKRKMEVEL